MSTVEICSVAAAGKLQQVGHQVAHSLRLLLDDLQGPAPRVVRGRARQDGFDPQAHRGQGVVQLVGDAGRQLAHAGQLGRLPELLGHGPDFVAFRLQLCHGFLQMLLLSWRSFSAASAR